MRKLLSITAFVAGALVLVAGSLLLFRLMQFRSAVNQIQNQGFPVSTSDLRKPVDDKENSTTILLNRLAAPLSSFEEEMWIDEEVMQRPVDEEMIQRFNEINSAYPNVFPLIEELSRATELNLELDGDGQEFLDDLLEQTGIVRSSARVLAWKMRILAADGKPDDAIATGLQIFHLSRLFDQCPMILSHLFTNACRGIAVDQIHEIIVNDPITDETRRRLNRELEAQDTLRGYAPSLIGERAFGIEAISEMGIFQMAYGGKGYLDVIGEEIDNADKEHYEQERFVQSRYSDLMNGWFGASLFPALEQVRNSSSLTRSKLRALRIISALQTQPDSVTAAISPDYLVKIGVPPAMIMDTMNGEPMKVKRVDDRWIVYSVGANLVDDGGDSERRQDFVLGND